VNNNEFNFLWFFIGSGIYYPFLISICFTKEAFD